MFFRRNKNVTAPAVDTTEVLVMMRDRVIALMSEALEYKYNITITDEFVAIGDLYVRMRGTLAVCPLEDRTRLMEFLQVAQTMQEHMADVDLLWELAS